MDNKEENYILVFGASVVDIFGFSACSYRSCDSNPGRVKMSFGGVSRNIAENMARMGVNTKFISILGDDETGRSMIEHSQNIGYDMSNSLILKNGRTPTYMAILNENGEMVSAVADMESIKEMNSNFIKTKAGIIKNAEYTFLDADDPVNLKYILENFHGDTKFILDPVSSKKAERIKDLIHYFHTIKPNRVEAEVLCGFEIRTDEDMIRAGKYFLSLGIKQVFISLDADGIYYTNGKESGKVKALNPTVKNVTGAGDSFVAGLGYGYYKKLSILETIMISVTMSTITIANEDTIDLEMSLEKVEKAMSEINWKITKF
jgi:pseudouridine kinase